MTDALSRVLDEYSLRLSNWGRWGDDDDCGTTNLATPKQIRGAAQDIVSGDVVSIALPIGPDGPQSGRNGRFNCLRYSTSTGSDHSLGLQTWNGGPLPHEVGFADDTIVMHLHSATHWDSLGHVFHKGKGFNGVDATAVTAEGASRLGAEHLADRFVGGCVLVDLPRAMDVPWLEDGRAVTVDDLEQTLERQGVQLRSGDLLLVRTGKLARARAEGWGTYAGGDAPGLSIHTAPWLHQREVAAVAADTWGVEVRPPEFPGAYQPMHIIAIVYMGLPFGEMFDLEALSQACAEDGRYRGFLSGPPLPIVGTAGGPPGPVVIR
ncbi:cyclase family protein [Microbacterium sp. BR1]|uniref:cyclase family protein n=1 Tax=Microbacterium sp. BR1 TaxID=1070896 RepID=UPI000C2C91F1|nr:cyclase family protein [Microbacterium sp. BR1]